MSCDNVAILDKSDVWPRVSISEIAFISSGGTPSRSVQNYWNGEIPWVTPGELTNLKSKYLSETDEKITEEGLRKSGANLLPVNSLLVTTRATLGLVAINSVEMTTNQGFKNLIFNKKAFPDFYYHLIPYIKGQMIRRSSGTTFLEISTKNFSSIDVPFPSIQEQVHIAKVLDTLDDTIQITEQLIAKLKLMKQGMLHDLLTKGIDENGELRDPVKHPEQFKDSPLGLIPRDWEIRRVGEIGKCITGSTPPTKVDGVWDDYGTPFITPGELTGSSEIKSPERRLSSVGEKYTHLLPSGTLLTVCIGSTIGKTALTTEPCATNQQINALIPYDGFSAKYIENSFKKEMNNFLALAGLQAVPIVNRTKFESLKLCVAQTHEQEFITNRINQIESRINTESSYSSKLSSIKKGLLNDLLSGKVRIPEEALNG